MELYYFTAFAKQTLQPDHTPLELPMWSEAAQPKAGMEDDVRCMCWSMHCVHVSVRPAPRRPAMEVRACLLLPCPCFVVTVRTRMNMLMNMRFEYKFRGNLNANFQEATQNKISFRACLTCLWRFR